MFFPPTLFVFLVRSWNSSSLMVNTNYVRVLPIDKNGIKSLHFFIFTFSTSYYFNNIPLNLWINCAGLTVKLYLNKKRWESSLSSVDKSDKKLIFPFIWRWESCLYMRIAAVSRILERGLQVVYSLHPLQSCSRFQGIYYTICYK